MIEESKSVWVKIEYAEQTDEEETCTHAKYQGISYSNS